MTTKRKFVKHELKIPRGVKRVFVLEIHGYKQVATLKPKTLELKIIGNFEFRDLKLVNEWCASCTDKLYEEFSVRK